MSRPWIDRAYQVAMMFSIGVLLLGCAARDEKLPGRRTFGPTATCTSNCGSPEFKPSSTVSRAALIESSLAMGKELEFHLNLSARNGVIEHADACRKSVLLYTLPQVVVTEDSRTNCAFEVPKASVKESIEFKATTTLALPGQIVGLRLNQTDLNQAALNLFRGSLPARVELNSVNAFSQLRPLVNPKDSLDLRGNRSLTATLVELRSGVMTFEVNVDVFLTYYLNKKDFSDDGRITSRSQNLRFNYLVTDSGVQFIQAEAIGAKANSSVPSQLNHFSNRRARGDSRSLIKTHEYQFSEPLLLDMAGPLGATTLYSYVVDSLL